GGSMAAPLEQRLALACLALPVPLALPQDVATRAVTEEGRVVFRTAEPLSVYEAIELARLAGGALVTIESAEKESWVLDNFGATEPYWIGLEFPRDLWQSGAACTFT